MNPQSIHLLMPMSGQGTRYREAGYQQPKPAIPVNGRPMVERLLEEFPERWPSVFVMAENHRTTEVPPLLKRLRPQAKVLYVEPHTRGPGRAIEAGLDAIPDDAPVLVTYCDYGMVWDAARFEAFVRDTNCDACLVSYRGFHAHYLSPVPYAYSRMDNERVVEVREKGSFTAQRENEYASNGGYYFRTAKLLREALAYQTEHNLILNGESYTSLTVEALLKMRPNAHVRVFEIPGFFQWGTPTDLADFEYWERSFQAYNRNQGAPRPKVDQVLMPMAGLGSRFRELSKTPKPLLPLRDRPLFMAALDTLPQARNNVFVALAEFGSEAARAAPAASRIVSLAKTPEGQALSTEAGFKELEAQGDIIVSACDHGLVLNPARWAEFRAKPDCDAAIFTVQGFPGARRRPQAFAYVADTAGSQSEFPEVARVSVKVPLSNTPANDPLLVGTFWFRSKAVLERGLAQLKLENPRVNGELYLDSVFEVLMKMGLKVRRVPLEGYLGWGDPDSMAEALYWQEIFTGRRLDTRPRFPGWSV